MKKFLTLACIVSVSLLSPYCKKASQETVSIQFAVGSAKVVTPSGEKPAIAGLRVYLDDRIVTGSGSFVDLVLGTRGVIRVAENSDVALRTLTDDKGSSLQFDMDKGKILSVMGKLSKTSSFTVKTRTTIAAIRGTAFMVVADQYTSKVYVIKGEVLVRLAQEGTLAKRIETILTANKKVVVSEELAKEIAAGNKNLTAEPLSPKESEEIRKEIKDIKAGEKLHQDVLKELDEIAAAPEAKPQAEREVRRSEEKKTPPKEEQSVPSIPSL